MKRMILYLMLLLTIAGNAGAVEPFDTQAGMAAYVNVGSLNLENAIEAYNQINNLSTSHAVGLINIGNVYGSDNIHVYVDVNGWIVAYITRDEQLGKIVQWNAINYTNPVIKTTFEDAISIVSSKIGVNYSEIKGNIKYYDFEHPQATNIVVFMNVRNGAGSDYTTVLIQDNYLLYEMSFSHFGGYNDWNYYYPSNLYLDGNLISKTTYGIRRNLGNYDPNILTKDVPHTILLQESLSGGVASIIIYK